MPISMMLIVPAASRLKNLRWKSISRMVSPRISKMGSSNSSPRRSSSPPGQLDDKQPIALGRVGGADRFDDLEGLGFPCARGAVHIGPAAGDKIDLHRTLFQVAVEVVAVGVAVSQQGWRARHRDAVQHGRRTAQHDLVAVDGGGIQPGAPESLQVDVDVAAAVAGSDAERPLVFDRAGRSGTGPAAGVEGQGHLVAGANGSGERVAVGVELNLDRGLTVQAQSVAVGVGHRELVAVNAGGIQGGKPPRTRRR